VYVSVEGLQMRVFGGLLVFDIVRPNPVHISHKTGTIQIHRGKSFLKATFATKIKRERTICA